MVNIFNGSFVSTGSQHILELRGGIDAIEVWNMTELAAANAGAAVSFAWINGMNPHDGIVYFRNGGANAIDASTCVTETVGGFQLFDTSVNNPGALRATTDVGTTAHRVLTANTTGLSVGSIVRLFNMTGAHEFDGIDFTVTAVNAGVSFDIDWSPVTVAAAAAGSYRLIPFEKEFYPQSRYISSITQAAQAVVQMTAISSFDVGQQVRFYVGPEYGMVEINGLTGNVLAVDLVNNTITVDIDTTAFTAFAWPLTAVAAIPHTLAQVVPVGENTAVALAQLPPVDILTDATINRNLIGIILEANGGPAGSQGDVIFWRATSSFNL
jgi:hypothetical protein